MIDGNALCLKREHLITVARIIWHDEILYICNMWSCFFICCESHVRSSSSSDSSSNIVLIRISYLANFVANDSSSKRLLMVITCTWCQAAFTSV